PPGVWGRVRTGVFPAAELGVLTAHRGARSSHGRRAAGPHLQPRQQHAQCQGHPKVCAGQQSRALHALHPGGPPDRRPGRHRLLRVPAERADQQTEQDLADPAAGGAAEEAAGQSVTPQHRGAGDGGWLGEGTTGPGAPHTAPPSAGAKPVNKMNMAMVNSPMIMRVRPLVPSAGSTAMAPASNRTEDQVKHLLQQADPRKMFPELKDNLMDNLKRLKSTMAYEDWQSFESWMHKWLLFEMAKNPKPKEEHKEIPAKKVGATAAARTSPEQEEMFSGVDMLRLGAEKAN
uniref:Uncharacterized protein n=1 Tax=Melopsittacus undulatus TaxID=13146 RepID=A0A8V5G9X1_MELUD